MDTKRLLSLKIRRPKAELSKKKSLYNVGGKMPVFLVYLSMRWGSFGFDKSHRTNNLLLM